MPTLFPFQPTALVEAIRFNTDIRATVDGEIRDSLMDGDYRLAMEIEDIHEVAARAEGLVRSTAFDDYYVPLWQDASRVETTISASDTTISVNTDADYRAGGFAAIIKDDQNAEVVTVTSAAGGTLTCSAVAGTYTASANAPVFVMPVVLGKLPLGMRRGDLERTSLLGLEWVCPDPVDLAATLFPTHLTYDVVTDSSILFGSLDGSIYQLFEEVRNAFGHIDLEELESYARGRGTITAFDTTQTARFNRRKWIHRLRGRDMPFFLPSWKNDMPLRATVASAAVTARVQRTTPVEADLVGRSLQFLLADGTTIHRQITGAAAVGGDPTSLDLTIAAPGQDIPTTAIVSLLSLVRLDADEIEITHTAASGSLHSAFSAPVVEVQA